MALPLTAGLTVESETPAHIVQNYAKTHGAWIRCQNVIFEVIHEDLAGQGWTMLREPIIPTSEGSRKPDIITYTPSNVIIIGS